MTALNKPAVWKSIHLPDGEQIILASSYEDGSPLSLNDYNHNLFRLNKEGEVIWQVKREEHGRLNWDAANRHAREDGMDGARISFGEIRLSNAKHEWLHDINQWRPGLKLIALSRGIYEVDIENGIAHNVTPIPWRDW